MTEHCGFARAHPAFGKYEPLSIQSSGTGACALARCSRARRTIPRSRRQPLKDSGRLLVRGTSRRMPLVGSREGTTGARPSVAVDARTCTRRARLGARERHVPSHPARARLASEWRTSRDSACAGAVLKCTVPGSPRTAPAITPNLVVCLHHSPSSSSDRARAASPNLARSPRKPSAAISNPRKLGVARVLHAAPPDCIHPDAPASVFAHFSFPPPSLLPCYLPPGPQAANPTPRQQPLVAL